MPESHTTPKEPETLQDLWPFPDDGDWLIGKEQFMKAVFKACDMRRAASNNPQTTKLHVASEVYELVAELIRVGDASRVLDGFASNNPKVKHARRLLAEREDELMGAMYG